MRNLPRARITAPAVHAFLFALAYAFWLLFEKGTHNPAKLDLLGILWLADLPISVLASVITLAMLFTRTKPLTMQGLRLYCGEFSEPSGGISWASQ
jgi:hypothetical protein